MKQNAQKTILDNGVRVVTETIDSVRTAAVGLWFETGSRDEMPEERGLSHFLEHMLFKGTKKRSALKIAREIEQVGGHMNAFTGKEITAFHAVLLDDFLPLAVDTLTDMASRSEFADKEIAREQGVVLEEISGYEDTPEDVIHEDHSRLVFGDHPLGQPILGTRETVSSFDRDKVIEYWSRRYQPERLVVAAAGAVDHGKMCKMIERKLSLPEHPMPRWGRGVPSMVEERRHDRTKSIVQAHLIIGNRGFSYQDKRRYSYFVMNTILGGGMSSRLFQRLREKAGLAYSIYTFSEAYQDSGMYGIYAGLEEKNVKKAEKMIRSELKKIIEKPVGKTTLKRAKDQLKGGLTLGLESTNARMHRLARTELYLKRYVSLDELLEGIDAVTEEDVQEVAHALFGDELFVTTLLPDGTAPGNGR